VVAGQVHRDGLDHVSEVFTPGETAAYKTRIVVWRPEDSARFNGTVVVRVR
jgi:hypothetical protein